MNEITLSIKEIVNAYLDYNGLSIAFMSRITGIPDSTLRYWLKDKININKTNLMKVKRFLKGNFLIDIDSIVEELKLPREAWREKAEAYLKYNHLTISYMSRVTRIPDTTLREWVNGEIGISTKNLNSVKQFLTGNFLLDASTIINELLIQKEIATDENRTD